MFRTYDQRQSYLLPPRLEDFVDESHPVRVINDLVEKLELEVLYTHYGAMGQPAYEPRLMLKVILYGFSVGIFSARKLARACVENLAFQYLTGMARPSFKTFIEFRQRHREEMGEVFVQTAKLGRGLGLARLGQVALDGSKIQANTSKHKAMSYGRMREEEKRLKEEMESLLKRAEETDEAENQEVGEEEDGYSLKGELARRESRLKKIEEAKKALEEREKKEHPDEEGIDPKKQISFADKEARCFAKKSEGTRYVYNGQVAVDMESQVIVENHIEESVQDGGAVGQALEHMKRGLGEVPKKLVMDGGYANSGTLKSCEAHDVIPVCSPSREDKERETGKPKPVRLDSFSYDRERDEFRCGHGTLFLRERAEEARDRTVYCGEGSSVCGCGHEWRKDGWILRVPDSHLARRELDWIVKQPENQVLYRRRKCTVEPVFGQIKFGMGFQRFLYRGLKNVRSEWNTVCAAFNLKKIAALIRAKPRPGPAGAAWARIGQMFVGHFCRHLVQSHDLFQILLARINIQRMLWTRSLVEFFKTLPTNCSSS